MGFITIQCTWYQKGQLSHLIDSSPNFGISLQACAHSQHGNLGLRAMDSDTHESNTINKDKRATKTFGKNH